MRRRAHVDETLQPVVMPGRILNELYKHALDAQPEECCGLIVGDHDDRYQRLELCRNDMTRRHEQDPVGYPRNGRDAFFMNQIDYERAVARAEAEGLAVTAVYHSHVGSSVYLSEMDLRYAESSLFPFPGAEQIVISVVEGREGGRGQVGGLGVFRRENPGAPFVGRSVKPLVP